MSFQATETSRTRGSPITLIKFTSGSIVLGYTDYETAVVASGVTYKAVPLSRDAIKVQGSLDKADLTIELPKSEEIAELFRVFPPSHVTSITIFQGHRDDADSEFKAVWTGRVLSCKRTSSTAMLLCQPFSTMLSRPGLRRNYQYGCPHVLYGSACKVVKASFTVSVPVLTVSGTMFTLSPGWNGSFAQSRFANGLAEWDSGANQAIRSIIKVESGLNRITIGGTTQGLAPGDTIALSLGCARTQDDCTLFSNINNFGGQPWIPTENPMSQKSQFY